MERIVSEESNVCFCLIGRYRKQVPQKLEKYVKCLGYREDLQEVLAMTDLFLNPKRMGAGGGAVYAIGVGVPVITLPDCDVAASVGDGFICNSYDEMYDLTKKYIHDNDFYASQVKLCKVRSEEGYSVDLASEIENILHCVRQDSKEL